MTNTRDTLFSSIVVGVTGSELLDHRLMAIARQLAADNDAKITAVSVLPASAHIPHGTGAPVGAVSTTPDLTHASEKRRIEERRKNLTNRLSELIDLDGAKVEVRYGLVNEQLLTAAEEHKADLIIVGRHDRNWFRELLSTGTGGEVARLGDIPTMIIPEAIAQSQLEVN